jgi:hypothetical protein
MNVCDVSGWSNHECRVVYFDFTIRGEGPAPLIQAVLRRWHEQGVLEDEEYDLWFDALVWRECGNLLPGWIPLAPRIDLPASRDESARSEEQAAFLDWHRRRVARNRCRAVHKPSAVFGQ